MKIHNKLLLFIFILSFVSVIAYYQANGTFEVNEVSKANTGSITTNETSGRNPDYFWVTDVGLKRVTQLNSSFDCYDFTVSCNSQWTLTETPYELYTNTTDFWVLDAIGDNITHRDSSFNYIDSHDTNDYGCSQPSGLTGNGTNLWVACNDDDNVHLLNLTYGNLSSYSVTDCRSGGDLSISGLSKSDSYFYLLNNDAGSDLHEVCRFDTSWNFVDRVNLSNGNISLDDGDGIAVTSGADFWITYSIGTTYMEVMKVSDLNDTTAPNLVLLDPDNITYSATVTQINYSVSDDVSLESCWYSLNGGSTNVSMTCGNNVTGLNSGEGTFTWTIYANDSSGNENISSVTFTVAFAAPTSSLDAPSDNSFLDSGTNVYFNYTVTDLNGIDTVELWGNFTGTWAKNLTRTDVISGIQAFSQLNLSDGTYIWTIWSNDTAGTSQFNDTNFTVTIDTTKPIFNNITVTTTLNSQTVSFNASNYTELYCDSTYYSVFILGGGIENGIENETTNCTDFWDTFVVSDYANYTLRVYMNDTSGNLNFTDVNFTTSQNLTVGGGGGGGGGSSTEVVRIPATNFSVKSRSFGNILDVVLSKDSVEPRTTSFILINDDIDEVIVNLECDVDEIEQPNGINICDYVTFETTNLSLSTNEVQNTIGILKIKTPNNASYGDEYSFNILAISRDGVSEKFSKLSVTVSVPVWATILKWSHLPIVQQDLPEEEKTSYPVAIPSIFFAFIMFLLTFLILRRDFPGGGLILGLILGFITFIISIVLL